MESKIAIIGKEGTDLAALGRAMRDHGMQPQVLEVGAPPAPSKPRTTGGMASGAPFPLNRKQRRAQEKQRRSKTFQKTRDAQLERAQKQMQAQIDAQRDLERRKDLPFAHPDNVVGIDRVFGPIDGVIDQIEKTGKIDALEDGTPTLLVPEAGMRFSAVDTVISIAETWEKMARTFGWNDHSEGLRNIGTKLERREPLDEEDLAAARKTILWMKACVLTITPRQFYAEAQEVQIRHELKEKGLAQ